MEQSDLMDPVEEQDDEQDEILPVPFGIMGIAFLCNVLQYTLFLGLTMGVLIVLHILRPS